MFFLRTYVPGKGVTNSIFTWTSQTLFSRGQKDAPNSRLIHAK
jgi:hypothetical protein